MSGPRGWILIGMLLGVLVGAVFIVATSPDIASRAPWIFRVAFLVASLPAATAISFFLLSLHAGFRRRFPSASSRFRLVGLAMGATFLGSVTAVGIYAYGVEVLKFHYLIHRVESARDIQEERRAFELAARWGHVWELNRLTKQGWLPERAQRLQADSVLELEWLECSAWTGKPFRAYRVVLDERNLEGMFEKGKRK